MFFEKAEEVVIDGNKYTLSMGAMNETFSGKERLADIYNFLDPS
jgi:hypothetical protein